MEGPAIQVGTQGTEHVGSDKYAFTVIAVKTCFKSGKHKGHPSKITIQKTHGSLVELRFNSVSGRWREAGETGRQVCTYTFGLAIDHLDPNY
ncbi:hypothetical protein ml_23 [Mollivirus sibericum]|uniref:hypothetical protein n=1 Tax=Mollivirus sibericum TaxID=1678078 RepID=UPI0006B2EE3A|nr:hypothetical protein ml_23 [Mollivirus sibericum]ALD61825.1 hypothetical protein ml_23 [Mollivirus sibericum]